MIDDFKKKLMEEILPVLDNYGIKYYEPEKADMLTGGYVSCIKIDPTTYCIKDVNVVKGKLLLTSNNHIRIRDSSEIYLFNGKQPNGSSRREMRYAESGFPLDCILLLAEGNLPNNVLSDLEKTLAATIPKE